MINHTNCDVFIVEDRYHNPDRKTNYTTFYISVGEDSISEASYEDLLTLRNIINRIEQEKKGGKQ